jgi:hypothetical protein
MLQLGQDLPSCVSPSNSLGGRSVVSQNSNDMAREDAALLQLSEPVTHILTTVLNMAYSVSIARCDLRIGCDGSVRMI